jgi:hypothetical protein
MHTFFLGFHKDGGSYRLSIGIQVSKASDRGILKGSGLSIRIPVGNSNDCGKVNNVEFLMTFYQNSNQKTNDD